MICKGVPSYGLSYGIFVLLNTSTKQLSIGFIHLCLPLEKEDGKLGKEIRSGKASERVPNMFLPG